MMTSEDDIPATCKTNSSKREATADWMTSDTSRLPQSIHLEVGQRRAQLVPHLPMRRACVPAMKLIIVVVVLLCVPVRGSHVHGRDSAWMTWLHRAMAPSATHARRALTSSHGRSTQALKGPESCGGCDSTRQFICSSNGRNK